MSSMQQVIGKIELPPLPQHLVAWVGQQQVEVRGPLHGKFYVNDDDLFESWNRYIQSNVHVIAQMNTRRMTVTLADGSRYMFCRLANIKDAYKNAGIEFNSVDIDRDVRDPEVLHYIRTRVRWIH